MSTNKPKKLFFAAANYLLCNLIFYAFSISATFTFTKLGNGNIWIFPLRAITIAAATILTLSLFNSLGLILYERFFKKKPLLIVPIICGMATIHILFLLLAFLKILTPIATILVISLPTLARPLASHVQDLYGRFRSEFPRMPTHLNIILIITIIIALFKNFLPVSEWDTLVYHIPIAKQFLTDATISTYPDQDPFNFPAAYALCYIHLVAIKLYESCSLLNIAIFLIGTFSLLKFAVAKKSLNLSKQISLFIIFATPAIWGSFYRCQPETLMFSVSVAALFVIFKLRNTASLQNVVFALIIGFLASIKISGAILAALLLFLHIYRNSPRLKGTTRTSLIICLLLVSPLFFWYGKNLIAFQSITYPKFAIQSSKSELLAKTLNFNKEHLEQQKHKYAKYDKLPDQDIRKITYKIINRAKKYDLGIDEKYATQKFTYGLYDLIFNQSLFARRLTDRYEYLFFLSLLPFWIKCKKLQSIAFLSLSFLALISIKAHLIRYAIPVFPYLAVLSAFAMQSIFAFLTTNLTRKTCFLLLYSYLGMGIYNNYINSHSMIKKEQTLKLISGKSNIKEWLLSRSLFRSPLIVSFNAETVKFAKKIQTTKDQNLLETLPQGVLMIGESKSLYFEKPYIADYDMIARMAMPWMRLNYKEAGNFNKITQNLINNDIGYIYIDLNYYWTVLRFYNYYQKNKIWVQQVDYCDPYLLELLLLNLADFLSKKAKLINSNYKKNNYLFAIGPN